MTRLDNYRASIIELRKQGFSAREIAKRLGLGKSSVADFLAKVDDDTDNEQLREEVSPTPPVASPAAVSPRVKTKGLPKIAFDREGSLDQLEEATIKRLIELVPAAPINTIPYLSNLLNVLQQRHLQQQPKTDIQINSITLALQQIRDSQITLFADTPDLPDT